jgi:sigma-B regulation protein RsbU (phosphoserine phosphatase)
MLPRPHHTAPGCDLSALVEPATLVGGDLYDYFPVGKRHLLFLVGDVSGKGVHAALFMVRALTVIRAVAAREDRPAGILRRANEELCRDNDAAMFVTACCGILDGETGEVSLASAGHELPLRLSPGRSSEFVPVPGGPALGIDETSDYPETVIGLGRDESLLLYSDGITEATDRGRRFFTEARLLQVASVHAGRGAGRLTDGLLGEVRKFAGGAPQSDDITLLALSRHGDPTSEEGA